MLTRDEAIARADAWINGNAAEGERLDVGVHEFEQGFVVWGITPPPAAHSGPPSTVGSARGVIDRLSGELSVWPPQPVQEIARQYAETQLARQRFPADVLAILRAAGWYPGRQADTAAWSATVSAIPVDGPEPELSEPVQRVLTEFGGLHAEPANAFAFSIAPGGHHPDPELFDGLAGILNLPLYPIGVRHDDGPSEIAMDPAGRVFIAHWAGSYFLGETATDAIIKLARGVGTSLPEVLEDGSFRTP
jgi:hypothetical protein